MSIETNKSNPFSGSNASPGIIFRDEDLRSIKFEGANLKNVVFEKCTVGISLSNRAIIFLIAACLSLFAGYIAMLSGAMTQVLLTSEVTRLQLAGYIICGLFIVFTAFAIWSGLNYKTARVAMVMLIVVIIVGMGSYIVDATAAGVGALYGLAALLLLFAMLVIGTVARATAGSLRSTIIFIIVALGGGIFAKSLGGGIGTLIMTIATAVISKRALSNPQDSLVKTIALRISTAFGTSFKNADLSGATFSNMEMKNCNFDGAKLDNIILKDVTETLCYYGSSAKTLTWDSPKE